jgi:hypothetical protein
MLLLAFVVDGVELDVDVRVRPLVARDDPVELELQVRLVRRERMMRVRRRSVNAVTAAEILAD